MAMNLPLRLAGIFFVAQQRTQAASEPKAAPSLDGLQMLEDRRHTEYADRAF